MKTMTRTGFSRVTAQASLAVGLLLLTACGSGSGGGGLDRPNLASAGRVTFTAGTETTSITFPNSGGGLVLQCTVSPILPIGLTLSPTSDSASCRITGTPDAVSGRTIYGVTAYNARGADITEASVSIEVVAAGPAVASVTATTVDINVPSSSATGTAYAMLLPAGAAVPTAAAIKAAEAGTGGVVAAGNGAVAADGSMTIRLTGLTAATMYDAYVVVESSEGVFSTMAKIDVATQLVPTPVLAQPDLANASAASFTVGMRATIAFTNNGGGVLTSCAASPPLPNGLSVSRTGDNGSCEITGTPSVSSNRTTYMVAATNATGTGAGTVSIAVMAAPPVLARPDLANASAASFTVGMRATIAFINNGGGVLTSCAVVPPLPNGLGVSRTGDNGSCEITGIPTAVAVATAYTVIATNATGTGAGTVSIAVMAAPPVLARPDLANASAASFVAGTEITAITFVNSGGGALTNCAVAPPLPNGLDVSRTGDNGSCRITGTPTFVSNRTTYMVAATNATGDNSATVSITVAPARPSLADAPAASFVAGTEITAITFVNSGGGALTNCAVVPPLPNGLDVSPTGDNGSCRITGTPGVASSQTTYTVTATNATGGNSATVSITVAPARPNLANASAASFTVGMRATIAFINNGGGSLTNCAVAPPLPNGLDVSLTGDNGSCRITGTPSVASSQTTYTVTATNATGDDATPATVSITVAPARPDLADAPAASFTAGTEITAITFTNSGGGSLTNCAVAPPLPTGLDASLTGDNGSCRITGTPTAVAGATAYTVTATNASGDDATPATVSITVAPARPDLADAFTANLTVGDRAAITFTNKGGGSLTSCTVAPPLPSGLDVSRTGDNGSCRITGTPSVSSNRTIYTVTATNVTGSGTAEVSITVAPARPDLADAPAASFIAGTEITTITFVNNGGGALTNCAVAPPLPNGLDVSLTGDNGSCRITGTPSVASSQTTYTVTATNVTGSGTAEVSITVAPALPDLADAFAANLTVGDRAAITFTNKGGGSLTNCTVASPLPSGLDVSRTGDNGSCRITGTPGVSSNRTIYTVTATNATGSGTAEVSITVAPALPDLADAPAVSFTAGTEITAITFANNGGGMLTDCAVNPPLPNGLDVSPTGDNGSCRITGTPGVASSQTTYTVTATNASGNDMATVSITVAPARPNLADAPAASFTAGTEITAITFTNNGGGSLTNCAVAPPLPTGLDVSLTSDNGSCRITGIPTTPAAVAAYTVTATNATGDDTTPATVSITVAPARPDLADTAANLRTGDQATIIFVNSGGGSLTNCAVAPPLPTGLDVSLTDDNGSCRITGIPTTPAAVAAYTVTATNATGSDTADASITVTVSLAQPDLADVGAANLTVGDRAAIVFTNNGGGSLTRCAVSSGLPAGLTLDRTSGNGSCEITGIPTAVAGATAYTVTATNATGDDATPATVSITVAPARPDLADAPAASFTAGTEITAITFANSGGGSLTSCTVAPPLPTGLDASLTDDNGSCRITGTPNAISSQTTYTVTATNATGDDATPATVSITVAPARPDLADAPAASFTAGTEITAITFANNGGGALTNCAVAPPLPTGLDASLTDDNGSCRITGTPNAISSQTTYTVTATNATGDDATPATVSITVAPARPDLADAPAASFTAGTEITAITFTNSGGGSLTNCAVAPPLPNGLDVSRTGDSASCRITGIPTTPAAVTAYTVTATNATGDDATPATVSITVAPARPSLADASAASFTAGTEITAITFTNSGGGSLTNCAVAPPLPTGLDASLTDDNGSCRITGTPSVSSVQTTYTVTATNASGNDTATVSILVNPVLPSLADVTTTAKLTAGIQAATIEFANSGGGHLTDCTVSPDLPTGLAVEVFNTGDDASCRIAGTPALDAVTARTTYTVTAINASGSNTADVSILVNPARPDLADVANASLPASTEITPIIFANGGGGALTNCAVAPPLPNDLIVSLTDDNGSCRITGIPTTPAAENTYTVTATNVTGDNSATVSITVAAPLTQPVLADARVARLVAGTEATIEFGNSGGGHLTDCTVAPPLPNDLMVSRTDGNGSCQITGTPTAPADTSIYTVTATNAAGKSAGAFVTLTVAPARPNLADATTAASFVAGTEITAITFTNSGGGSLTNCAVAPPLPNGLDVSPTGDSASCRITGTPTVTATVTAYTVTATNATGDDATPATVSITVAPARPSLADAPAASFTAGTEITAITFANSGGGALTNCAVAPPLPTGLTASPTGDSASCRITGTPDAAAAENTYTVTATNVTGDDATPATVSITVVAPLVQPALVDADAAILVVGTEATIEFANSGGGDLTSCTVAPPLPVGLGVSRTDGNGSCQITGTPDAIKGTSIYTVIATNAAGKSAGAVVSITVTPVQPDLVATSAILVAGTQATVDIINNGGGHLTDCTVSPDLPTGLAVEVFNTGDDASCRITGTPDAATARATYTVVASNATGDSNAVVTLTVNLSRPSLADAAAVSLMASSDPLSLTAGADAADIEFASNGGYLSSCTVSPPLPAGLGVSTSDNKITCRITGIPTAATAKNTYTVTATNAEGNDSADVTITVTAIDADGDGLIEISTLEQLDDMRHSLAGAGYQDGSGAAPNSSGCPSTGCFGYELAASLTLDADGDGSTWVRNSDGSTTLDMGDNNDDYFDIASDGSSGGWVPIGDCGADGVCGSADDAHFTAVFEGRGHTITGLATRRDIDFIGLFGYTSGAEIRNLGLVGNLASGVAVRNRVGGLVGFMSGGSIVASYATGDVASGTDHSNRVGGLVGHLDGGAITASYASGDVDGGAGDDDRVGGLVGWQDGSIIASYASGDVDGGAGDDDRVGGLVGRWDSGTITASYASGDVDGGDGNFDQAGSLVGWEDGTSIGTVVTTASWGFGGTARGKIGSSYSSSGSADRPAGITSPEGLTDAKMPAAWNAAANNTQGAWNLGTSRQPPMLAYADYDGVTMGRAGAYASGHLYHCASDSANAPAGAILIPDCGTLIPAVAANVMTTGADINVVSGAAGTAYIVVLEDGTMAPTAAAIKAAVAGSGGVVAASNAAVTAGARATIGLTGLEGETRYNAYIVVESGGASDRVLGRVMRVDLLTLRTLVDADGDGLIEVSTLEQLNNMRHSLDGSGYKTSGSATAVTAGCPSNVCRGYELMNDLDFDVDGDGSTWVRNSDGSTTLDTGDYNDTYFEIASGGTSGGWVPIGDGSNRFTAVFEGNGHTITGIATVRDLRYVGLFGTIGSSAEVRNLGLVGNLAKHNGNIGSLQRTNPAIGGLVGSQFGGAIVASHAAGEADGGLSNDYVGGLVGLQDGGAIVASYATGNVDGGTGNGGFVSNDDRVGGLVGLQDGGTITASHATGGVDGGAGSDYVGGLVGQQYSGGAIVASHATGDVDGGDGSDYVGGLVGWRTSGSITASYATGNADGGAGSNDIVGRLVGRQDGGTNTSSWGFGSAAGEIDGSSGTSRPNGVSSATDLTSSNAGSAWNSASHDTRGAWNFGTSSQAPALNYADYDGSGNRFHCARDLNAPDGAILIPYCTSTSTPLILEHILTVDVDADRDGLIEISTLEQLNNMRHSLDGSGYKTSGSATAVTTGCPSSGCIGYELVADLDFDADGDGSTWVRNSDGSTTLDTGDGNSAYFDIASDGSSGGWVPIGDNGNRFTAVFEGNGHTISGLATMRNLAYIGLFGRTSDAEIRNLGLVGNLARKTGAYLAHIGGLVGHQGGGSIIASQATGDVDGGVADTDDTVGGLVGLQDGGAIVASYATGDVDGGAGSSDFVGGLVGWQRNSTITASHATGDVGGGAGNGDIVGGLVGWQQSGTITASHATGDVDGGVADTGDIVGGLVGRWDSGTITASYATGDVDGGAGSSDRVGGLVGQQYGGAITASWGFGDTSGGEVLGIHGSVGSDGLSDRPVSSATDLAASNVPTSWNAAASSTQGAWNFGTSSQAPRLNYADYDGSGDRFHCARDLNAPDGAILIPYCTSTSTPLILEHILTVDVDADRDGLIEISTLEQLNNMRHSLDGSGYRDGASSTAVTIGCPSSGCIGYELVADLDFDVDGDGSTWVRNSDGSTTLDTGDDNSAYFDIASDGSSGGWVPIGDDGNRFTAVFEGNGHTISGLATMRNLPYIGLFGRTSDAEIRNLGLVGNLARRTGAYLAHTGGLVGHQGGGSIIASHATGDVDGGAGSSDYVGGLVGLQDGGAIVASYATGDVGGGAGSSDIVGGLVGWQQSGAITASHATGDVGGGAGSSDIVGGLVGWQRNSTITASYATGDVDGGVADTGDIVGGLVGRWDSGTITASYATGDVDGGDGSSDRVGGLVGQQYGGAITASWGFGDTSGGEVLGIHGSVGSDGLSDRPVSSATDLAASNVPTSWNAAASSTQGAWNFGTSSQMPALNYADYDGSGNRFHCARALNAPDGAILIPYCTSTSTPLISEHILIVDVDADRDGLIEISTLEQLNNMRHSLDGSGYRDRASATAVTTGCPSSGCIGYELVADLDFDADGDGSTWVRNSDGSTTLDTGDGNSAYFDIASDGSSGGWVPIGDNGNRFTAVFEGNGHTITGLATMRNLAYIGLFGRTSGAEIRNLGLVGNLARKTGAYRAHIGGLVGHQGGGSIIASHATGDVDGGAGSSDLVGGLVGLQSGGAIVASYATGNANGGAEDDDRVGGLVGSSSGTITASHATGDVSGGADDDDQVGGLVGLQSGGAITASFATGDVDGGADTGDIVGGLVGRWDSGAITASYATGDVDGGAGSSDRVGGLVGQQSGGAITASWGFGDTSGGEILGIHGSVGSDGLSDRPVSSATDLAASNVPTSWNAAASSTQGAWNFGTSSQTPALNYADYDGSGNRFHCAGAFNAPDGAIIIPDCDTLLSFVSIASLTDTTADITVVNGTDGTVYVVVLADGAEAPTAAAIKATATVSGAVTANTRASLGLTGLSAETLYNAYIVVESGGTLGEVMRFDLRTPLTAPDLRDRDDISINVGQQSSFSFANGGGGALTSCAVNPPLPTGLDVSRTSNNTKCQITGTPTVARIETRYTVTATNATGSDSAAVLITVVMLVVDADGDGLIEISTLEQLNNMRHSLDGIGYKTSGSATAVTTGCPLSGCIGYELMADLTFDKDGDGSTWHRNSDGSIILDDGDNNSQYFDTSAYFLGISDEGGWVPVGDDSNPFTAVFEGNGHTIIGLAVVGDIGYIGLFGVIDGDAKIRNLGLVGNLAWKIGATTNAVVGGLVGLQSGGAITASHATGDVGGTHGFSWISILAIHADPTTNVVVGGLVGQQNGGAIIASHATGNVGSSGISNRAGGLVGLQSGGAITASYATGNANGGAEYDDRVGGLVGSSSGTITASYATGDVSGGADDDDYAGGLVGLQSGGAITASYATGDVSGGTGSDDYAGGLVGLQSGGTITASWGFGSTSGELGGVYGSDDLPTGVTSTGGLASDNVPDEWNAVAGNTNGAWSFGDANQSPVLRYADYDGAEGDYHCASDADNASASALLIFNCGTEVPGQSLTGRTAVTLHFVDADRDGLIEVSTPEQLNNMRHSLDGIGYRDGPGARAIATGCPTGCIGYELMADLSFDKDGDGSTWVRNSDGSITLDTGDDNDTYFDIASDGSSGGWVPVGDNSSGSDSTRFTAVFEGNGHTITGLATVRDLGYIGLFGAIGTGAEIRNLGLVGNLARNTSTTSRAWVGGLAGLQDGGTIVASYATGDADGGGGNDGVGGLVGRQESGAITASYATGNADGGAGNDDQVGGLVGYQSGTITAAYAVGAVDGGAGNDDQVGGLVGFQDGGAITASYAIGAVDGGTGSGDIVGSLVGEQASGAITVSWGFGNTAGEVDGSSGSNDRPMGITSADGLTSNNAPDAWNLATSNTQGAWNFGTSSQPPMLTYADYDGSGNGFHCAGADNAPDNAIIIPDCDTLIFAFVPANLTGNTADINVVSDTDGTAYVAILADGAEAPTAAAIKAATKGVGSVVSNANGAVIYGARAVIGLTGLKGETPYSAYIVVESSKVLGRVMRVSLRTPLAAPDLADADAASLVAGSRASIVFTNNGSGKLTSCTVSPPLPAGLEVLSTIGNDTCQISGVPTAASSQTTYTVTVTNAAGMDTATVSITVAVSSGGVDADGDGLIEISTLAQLNNVRHSLDGAGYKTSASVSAVTTGCPSNVCRGYELIADLDFDGSDADTTTWRRNSDSSVTLDAGDTNSAYFDIADNGASGGWVPIGNCGADGACGDDSGTTEDESADDAFFTAVFEGNGHTIAGLATVRDLGQIGLFGVIDTGADIRNLGLVRNLAKYIGTSESQVGGLVGWQFGGSITASYATGDADGGDSNDIVGGLVGQQQSGTIVASYASGEINGSMDSSTTNSDIVGGLVGQQQGGAIVASYATGDADRSDSFISFARVGGLVGEQRGAITASYATGYAYGGTGLFEWVGGLVGQGGSSATITASYATAHVIDSSVASSDNAGGLVGDHGGAITASWGFGTTSGGERGTGNSGSSWPSDISRSAGNITASRAGDTWNSSARDTRGAWDFASGQAPALNLADYDGSGDGFHCTNDSTNPPDDAILIPDCGRLISGQGRPQSSPIIIGGYGGTLGGLGDFGSARGGVISASYYASASLWVPEGDAGNDSLDGGFDGSFGSGASLDSGTGSGTDSGNDGGNDAGNDTDDTADNDSLIATFDAATDDLAGIRANVGKYSLTGIFANPTLANWNSFDGEPDSAHVGGASVSTWEIGTMAEAQATGSIRINGVAISGDYINFLMAGGGGGADVGVSLYVAGTGMVLATYSPNFCADKYLKGGQHWAHFDVRVLDGLVVDLEIRDHDDTGDCGFIAFDHFYQSDNRQGTAAGVAAQPDSR